MRNRYIIFLIGIITCLFLCSQMVRAQSVNNFVFKSNSVENSTIKSATLLPNGKFAYSLNTDSFLLINVLDTSGNLLLSRQFKGVIQSNSKLIYHDGYIYCLSDLLDEFYTLDRKQIFLLSKLDTCLNLVKSKIVYYSKDPKLEYMQIHLEKFDIPVMYRNNEFFYLIKGIFKEDSDYKHWSNLLFFNTDLNIYFSPYFHRPVISYLSSKNDKCIISGEFIKIGENSFVEDTPKAFYSEYNPNSEELNYWIFEQLNDSFMYGARGNMLQSEKKLYVNGFYFKDSILIKKKFKGYQHGILDYTKQDSATLTYMSDTTKSNFTILMLDNWGKKGSITIIDNSSFIHPGNKERFFYYIRSFDKKLVQTITKPIYGWGNLNNGLDDSFNMEVMGSLILSQNKLLVYGEAFNEFGYPRAFYFVIDSNLNFASKKIDTSKYQCSKLRELPSLKIVPTDTFFMENSMFREAKMVFHNIKLNKVYYTASAPYIRDEQWHKSRFLKVKYLQDNSIECELQGLFSEAKYQLFDITSKIIQTGISMDNKIIISNQQLKSGIYTLLVTRNNEVISEKIIIR